MKIKTLILTLSLILVFGLAACNRSASESPTQVPGAEATVDQQAPSNMETAVAGGGFATQTAQAMEANQQGVTPEATPEAPTGEGEATEEPSAEPTTEGGESQPPAPTAAPTSAPASSSCASPYTVQTGEWVWSIGRKCNISPQAIIDANNLACFYDGAGNLQCPVFAGDKLVFPANPPPFVGP
jgi:LysM repeat protein